MAERFELRRAGISLYVERHGRPASSGAPALVLAHGFGGSARNFRPQLRVLRERFAVLLYDARGHGRSSAPDAEPAYTLPTLVADLDAVRASIEPPGAVIGGLSLGAMTALYAALRRPESVQKLILASLPIADSNQDRASANWAFDFAAAIEGEGLEAAGARFIWGRRSRFDPEGAALIRRGFLEHSPLALVRLLRAAVAPLPSLAELQPKLEGLSVPTLLVVGSEDSRCLETSRRAAALLPRAELVVIEGAGHVVNLAKVERFNKALVEFLERPV